MKRTVLLTVSCLAAACVYYNAMYDIERAYEQALEQRRGDRRSGGNTQYDSVIAKAERLIADHPESEHAARAALLKARSELARNRPEAAATTALTVSELTTDSALMTVASGLEGVAKQELGEYARAEDLLTLALRGQPSAEDRALFRFHRGLARLGAGNAEGAAEDLSSISDQGDLDVAVRLDLARGLAEAEQFEEAVALTAELVTDDQFMRVPSDMDAHLDSLVHWVPEAVQRAFGTQLASAQTAPTRLALLHYYRGFAAELMNDNEAALDRYDTASRAGGRGRYAAEAYYRWARLRIIGARRPADILAAQDALARARSVPDPKIIAHVDRLLARVGEFGQLVEAYETRGESAAEAALRAAEIAGADLGARRVARGLYLRYLELAPESPWRPKAIAGALFHADWPAGQWADDRGEATDVQLRTLLASLPSSNPYRISLEDLQPEPAIDSAYVELERDLRRRLIQIRMLYDTTAVLVDPSGEQGGRGDPEPSSEEQEDRPQVEL